MRKLEAVERARQEKLAAIARARAPGRARSRAPEPRRRRLPPAAQRSRRGRRRAAAAAAGCDHHRPTTTTTTTAATDSGLDAAHDNDGDAPRRRSRRRACPVPTHDAPAIGAPADRRRRRSLPPRPSGGGAVRALLPRRPLPLGRLDAERLRLLGARQLRLRAARDRATPFRRGAVELRRPGRILTAAARRPRLLRRARPRRHLPRQRALRRRAAHRRLRPDRLAGGEVVLEEVRRRPPDLVLTSQTSSISTGIPIGSAAMPTAERAAGRPRRRPRRGGPSAPLITCWLGGEVGVAPDHAEDLHDPRDVVEGAELVLDRAEAVERGQARGAVGLLERNVARHPPAERDLGAHRGAVTGHEEERPGARGQGEIRDRRERGRQLDAEMVEPVLDRPHVGETLLARLPAVPAPAVGTRFDHCLHRLVVRTRKPDVHSFSSLVRTDRRSRGSSRTTCSTASSATSASTRSRRASPTRYPSTAEAARPVAAARRRAARARARRRRADRARLRFATLPAVGTERPHGRPRRPRRHEPGRARRRRRPAGLARATTAASSCSRAIPHRCSRPRRARCSRSASGTTSSPRTGRRCSAPTTRPASPRSWPRSPGSSRIPRCRAPARGSRSPSTRRSATASTTSTSSASAPTSPTRSTGQVVGEIENETFSAVELKVTFHGRRRPSRPGQGEARQPDQARGAVRRRACRARRSRPRRPRDARDSCTRTEIRGRRRRGAPSR